MQSPIFGPAYSAKSTNLAANRLINLYQQIVEAQKSASGKAIGALEGCPGLDLVQTFGTGPVRAMKAVNLSGVGDNLYLVSGQSLYQTNTSFTVAAPLGTLSTTNDGPVTIVANDVGIAVAAGFNLYEWTPAGGFHQISTPFAPSSSAYGLPITLAELDGFIVANQPGSNFWYQSNLEDAATWDALNFAEASGDPDNIRALAQIHREFVLLKEYETEFWYNAGTAGFSFARIDGAYLEVGICAVGSRCRLGDSLVWLAQNQEGEGFVVELDGHKINRISTQALEAEWGGYSAIADATAYTYRQQGHEFYVLNFPSGDTTWVYDRSASRMLGEPCWHQRARFEPLTGTLHRHIGNTAALFAHKIVVGDYQTGALYAFNLSTLLDNGAQRKWVRSWRALAKPVYQPVTFSELCIYMQTGVGIDPAADPLVALRYSDDGGHTWSNERKLKVGTLGQTAKRVRTTRLGQTRENSGLDRIFELSSTDVFPVSITGAEVEAG
jgi:Phage stabilisation protein